MFKIIQKKGKLLSAKSPKIFDNFDTTKGVQIVSPTIQPVVESSGKKLVKKTVQSMPVNEAVSLRNKRTSSSSRVRMAMERSLGNFTTGDSKIDSYILDSSKRYDIDPLQRGRRRGDEISQSSSAVS
ncbi:MAG: hypothetical protein ABI686_09705 [Acidobacteriota bacterium]